jgi:hypothetical protein
MSKKNEGKVVVSDVVSAVVAPVVVEVKDGRGAKMGVPHITNKILAMSKENQEKWLTDKCATDEVRNEVRARLASIIANGRTATVKGKATDYASLFNGRDYDELTAAMVVLNTAIETALTEKEKQTVDLMNKFEQELVKIRQQKLVKA